MAVFPRRLAALYHQFPVESAVAGVLLVATLAIQIGRELESRNWPQHWEFHHRIQFARFEHAMPLFTYPGGGSNRFLPRLGAVDQLLRSGDSISKQAGANRFLLIRDSAAHRLLTQWAWNEATREFEFAGRSVHKR